MEIPSVFTDDEIITMCSLANIDWPHPTPTVDRESETEKRWAVVRGARNLRLRGVGVEELDLEPALARLSRVALMTKRIVLTTVQNSGDPNPQLPQLQIFGDQGQYSGMISSWDGAHEFVNLTEQEILSSIRDYLDTEPVDSDTYRVIVCRDPQTQQLWGHAFGNEVRSLKFPGDGSFSLGAKCLPPSEEQIVAKCQAALLAPATA